MSTALLGTWIPVSAELIEDSVDVRLWIEREFRWSFYCSMFNESKADALDVMERGTPTWDSPIYEECD